MPENELDMGDTLGLIYGIVGCLTIVFGLSLAGYWVEFAQYIELSGFWAIVLSLTNTEIAIASLMFGAIYILTGMLVWRRYKLGKVMATIIGAFAIFVFPIGTFAIAFPTFYILYMGKLKGEWKKELDLD